MIPEKPDLTITDTGETVLAEKTKRETDEKCPQCGAVLTFDPGSGGMHCGYCDYRRDVASDEQSVAELSFDSAEHRDSIDWGAEKKQIICKSCGAASIYDQLDIANECPFCGSNQVMQEKGADSLAPNAVAPFQVSAKQAETLFADWIKRQLFAPSKAKRQAKADRFNGLYLPYWTFDSDTFSTYTARYGIDRRVRQKDGTYRTETTWRNTSGTFDYFVDDVTVLASSRHSTHSLKGIEPFDFQSLKPYRPEYLAGFVSERYSVGIDDAWPLAKDQIARVLDGAISHQIRANYRADRVSNLRFDTTFSNRTYKYALLPLWMSSFSYQQKIYEFLVNGQTGKVSGKVPISVIRVIIAVLLGLALLAVILYFANDGGLRF